MVDSEGNCKFGLGVEGLTNRFHTAVGLFSNRSQTSSKCGTQGRAECVTAVLTTFWCLFFYSVKENKFLFPILDLQGWALVAPGDPWHLAFALGQLGGFFFFHILRSICWAPWISQFQSTVLPSIFLRAQPCAVSVCPKFSPCKFF